MKQLADHRLMNDCCVEYRPRGPRKSEAPTGRAPTGEHVARFKVLATQSILLDIPGFLFLWVFSCEDRFLLDFWRLGGSAPFFLRWNSRASESRVQCLCVFVSSFGEWWGRIYVKRGGGEVILVAAREFFFWQYEMHLKSSDIRLRTTWMF